MISYEPLIEHLKSNGITIKVLGELTGLSTATMAKFAKNESVTLETIDKICVLFGLPIENVVQIKAEDGELFSSGTYDDRLLRIIKELREELKEKEKLLESYVVTSEARKAKVFSPTVQSNREFSEGSFSKRVKEMRKTVGLTVKELADLSGLTQPTITNLENGSNTNPKINSVIKLCDVFGCSVDWLMFGDDNKN
ncbi:helix-turn-helix transcriptional regulator [Paenibacillus oleatilyticus]|uniref:helix-turn-helix transcriptional regulator n=1 Tax=Paenibacillus oleatilyticus TaxID=2594886 RepID=UPI001C1FC095|nr:helix-turn-helix transcriptional regulator [Paenibacillus oleatilyticus]MBU7316071.1 helix-turn-helix domain-containing protein [Paenibacillus oleatilyticus]